MNKHLNIKISGQVRGVGFRFCAYEKFVEFGMVGKAENTKEGDVFIDVEGPEERMPMLIDWCHQGPTGAKVTAVEVVEPTEPFVPLKMG